MRITKRMVQRVLGQGKSLRVDDGLCPGDIKGLDQWPHLNGVKAVRLEFEAPIDVGWEPVTNPQGNLQQFRVAPIPEFSGPLYAICHNTALWSVQKFKEIALVAVGEVHLALHLAHVCLWNSEGFVGRLSRGI
jgi:hypothetical protein